MHHLVFNYFSINTSNILQPVDGTQILSIYSKAFLD